MLRVLDILKFINLEFPIIFSFIYFLLKFNFNDLRIQVMLSGLADTWPARHKWTTDQLLLNYGDVAFKISQRGARKISMKFKDYVSYMKVQHDEDPLYIFDEKVLFVRPPCTISFPISCSAVFESMQVLLTFFFTINSVW